MQGTEEQSFAANVWNFSTIGTIHNTFVCKEVNEITVIVMVCHGHMVI